MVNKGKPRDKQFYSVSEAAKLLGISRIAVHKRIKNGKIAATKVGRAYVISAKALGTLATGVLTDKLKTEIAKGVSKVVKEYGETLKMLGRE